MRRRWVPSLRGLVVLALIAGLVVGPALAQEQSVDRAEAGASTADAPADVTAPADEKAGADPASPPVDPRVRALIEAAEKAEPEITALMQSLADDLGGRLERLDHRLKTAESIERKLEEKVADGTAPRVEDVRINDMLRYTLVIKDSPAGAYVSGARKVFPTLTRRGHRVDRIYNYWPRGDSYAGINSTLETRDGLRWELQIHTPDSYDATREGRSLYERMRRTDVSPEERGAIFEQLVDLWDLVPIPKGALAQGAINPRDRLVVRDEFGQIGSAAQEAKSEAWALRWRNGVWMESADGAHRLHVGGRVLLDAGVVNESPGLVNATFQGTSSGVKFRQARVLVEGQLFRHLAFKVNYEFAGGEVGFADVYAAVVNAGPTDVIRVGHMKVPFSFEQAMSRKYMTFMERSLANALAPDVRETGFEVFGTLMSGRLRWDAGAFRETDASGDGFGSDNGYDLALRVTGLPIRSNGNRRLLHLGLSYVHQFRDGSGDAFSTRPESFLADTLLNTGTIEVTGVDILGLELVAVAGSFSLEAEYLRDFVQRSYQPTVQFHGGYVQVAYYLTGESRSYTLTSGHFGRIVPNRNVALGAPGWGAWQLAARFSRVDLDDRNVGGGTETNGTFAINWFPSPITRLSTEYVYGKVDRQGDVHVWQIRFQFEF